MGRTAVPESAIKMRERSNPVVSEIGHTLLILKENQSHRSVRAVLSYFSLQRGFLYDHYEDVRSACQCQHQVPEKYDVERLGTWSVEDEE